MADQRDRDDRFRGRGEEDNRWQGNRAEREGGSFGNWGSDRDTRDRQRGPAGGDDRGFMERAGEEVRSWFGGDDDRSGGRGGGDVRWQGSSEGQFRGDPVHYRDRGDRPSGDRNRQGYGSAFGSQGDDRYRAGSGGGGGGGGGGGTAGDYDVGSGGAADSWGGSGFGGDYDRGRRFDRIDAGSTGTQGAHPMSAPVGGGYGSIGSGGGYSGGGSSAREAAIIRQAQAQGQGADQHHHDRHYSEWRNRQIEELDRDYHEYRQEHQSKFEQEFGGWRQKRQTQRQHVGRAREHMEVLGSDGEHIGTVDKVRGDKIILTKSDQNAGGSHHSIPCSWIETVDDKVIVNKTAAEAMHAWTNEDQNRALFERPDQGSDGPHILDRSFSGTYGEKKG